MAMTGFASGDRLSRVGQLLLPLVILGGLSAPAWGRHGMMQHETADGLEVYIGLLPAPMIERFPKGSAEERMHGGTSGRERRYHLVAAIFDSATGQRIERADVRARLTPLGLGSTDKHLEPMTIQGAASYGQYFDLPTNGQYAVSVTVRRAHQAPPVVAEFKLSVQ